MQYSPACPRRASENSGQRSDEDVPRKAFRAAAAKCVEVVERMQTEW